jgi:glycosyltransferase involved in cell wall biosynthesis
MHVGGTELNALRTAERLDRSQFAVTVLSIQPNGPIAKRYQAAGIPVVGFPLTSLYAPRTAVQGLRFARYLRAEQIDILHCHDLYANLFGATWGRAAGLRSVITSRRWIHPLRNRQLELANRLVHRVGHWVWANSRAVVNAVVSEGVAIERILHVPNFVDESAFSELPQSAKLRLRAELGIPADATVIGCIARLAPVKDHGTLLQAVSALSQQWSRLHLVLVGDGESRRDLEALTASLGIGDRVHFSGMRPNEPNLHGLFDISALTSLGEGFPNSLVEAMAAARPVVATRVGGNVDAVRSDTGILVEPRDPEELARAFGHLLANDALRRRMGAAAQRVARREYHADSVIPLVARTYRQLAGVAP